MDFGSGGLDLAYEVMRGYDALILIDVSRQGAAPGTLYVMEADPEDVDGQVEDGQLLDPHGMDPQTVLRFVKYVGGWPGRVIVIACEPEVVEDVGFGLSDAVKRSVAGAADVVLDTIAELRAEPVRHDA
jgi:hydrogenase maturation protease